MATVMFIECLRLIDLFDSAAIQKNGFSLMSAIRHVHEKNP